MKGSVKKSEPFLFKLTEADIEPQPEEAEWEEPESDWDGVLDRFGRALENAMQELPKEITVKIAPTKTLPRRN